MYKIRIKMGNMVWYPLKTLESISVMLGVVCMVWVAVSLVEIWCNNLDTEPIYSAWNYFNLLVK